MSTQQLTKVTDISADVAVVSFAFALDDKSSAKMLRDNQDIIAQQAQRENEPDVLVVYRTDDEGNAGFSSTLIRTTFFPTTDNKNTVQCVIGDELFTFDPGGRKASWAPEIRTRNQTAGFVLPDYQSEHAAQSILIAQGSNFPGDRVLHRGLMLKDEWETNENAGTKYFNEDNKSINYQPPEIFPAWWHDTREATLTQLDKRFREMRSELTADVIDILFHHWYQHRDPKRQEKAGITLSQLCEYRGIQAQEKNLAALWQAMRDARSFRLMGDGIDAALFEMDSAKAPQSNLFGLEDPPRADVAYFYSPGFFLAQAIKENPIYLAPYVRKVWELDPRKHSNAKRLARYLRGEWRMNTQKYLRAKNKEPNRYRTLQSILHDAGIDANEYLNSKNPSRLKEEVNAALRTLYDIGAVAECGATIYHPNDRCVLENLPRNGAMKAWLQLRVCIDPPAEVSDALQEPNEKRIKRAIEAATSDKKKRKSTKKAT